MRGPLLDGVGLEKGRTLPRGYLPVLLDQLTGGASFGPTPTLPGHGGFDLNKEGKRPIDSDRHVASQARLQ